jgi:hypothetical protein
VHHQYVYTLFIYPYFLRYRGLNPGLCIGWAGALLLEPWCQPLIYFKPMDFCYYINMKGKTTLLSGENRLQPSNMWDWTEGLSFNKTLSSNK